ncbi:MAG: hypothetical protein JWR85_3345 [Marmoricola sp.]|nr:hypothetical protein [Marmoricola sp.]
MADRPAGWYRRRGDGPQHVYWDGLTWVEPDGDVAPEDESIKPEDGPASS